MLNLELAFIIAIFVIILLFFISFGLVIKLLRDNKNLKEQALNLKKEQDNLYEINMKISSLLESFALSSISKTELGELIKEFITSEDLNTVIEENNKNYDEQLFILYELINECKEREETINLDAVVKSVSKSIKKFYDDDFNM